LSGAAVAVSINSLSGNVDIGYSGNVSGFGAATFLGVENFHISSGAANDIITTGGGDVVHAGAGSDIVNLAGGNDEAVYTMAANDDAYDIYQGDDGVDTLTLEFTKDEWFDAKVQSAITLYQAHLARGSSHTFTFGDSLTVSEFEHLSVRIDGGAGADTFEFGANAQNLMIFLGEGDEAEDSVTFKGAVYNTTINNWEHGVDVKVDVVNPEAWTAQVVGGYAVLTTDDAQSLTFMDISGPALDVSDFLM
jgi:hypothetical protein